MKRLIWLTPALALFATSCAHRHHTEGHAHGPNCGHIAIAHDGHTDYLHAGHLHNKHGRHADEHVLAVNATNPDQCTPDHACAAHPKNHAHTAECGHEAVPHGDHTDYLVDGHLHYVHGAHCDDHGQVNLAAK